ncbi:hypothetical protein [Methylobacterium sp. J-070]|uniref:hypothetical protein n=1 Tax=Methylobacterium sp. J-070 TaxID=2836650 RepID=UPI001FBAEBCA|nr:hypothetical protein [Methylobacterium sp. J-070]MCJ2054734.1 hypothetical protein [Methylobacterium sp. J-070]
MSSHRETLTMRRLLVASLCLSAATASPVLAQVQQNDPNAANRSLESSSQIRTLQQDQTTRNDMLRMDIQRNQAATPGPVIGPNPTGPGIGAPGRIGR